MKEQLRSAALSLLDQQPPLSLHPQSIRDGGLDQAVASWERENAMQHQEARALLAGLHLCNGNLDASHRLSQSVDTPVGSYWHGIMHRMEGDYSNAAYWFMQAGIPTAWSILEQAEIDEFRAKLADASVDERLRDMIMRLLDGGKWDARLFTEAAQQARSGCDIGRSILEGLQAIEMSELLSHTFQLCFGVSLD